MTKQTLVFSFLFLAAAGYCPGAPADQVVGRVSPPSTLFDFGFGLPMVSNRYTQQYQAGGVGHAINAELLQRIGDSDLLWGLDFGLSFFNFGSTPGLVPGASYEHGATVITPQLTLLYRLDGVAGTSLVPRLGVSTGPQIVLQHNRLEQPVAGQSDANSNTDLNWEVLARPALEYQLGGTFGLTFEGGFGVVAAQFIFQPELRLSMLL